MRIYPISDPVVSSFAVLGLGLLLFTGSFSPTQAAGDAQAAPKPAANGGLFPDAAEPVLVEKATLRTLLDAVAKKDGTAAEPIIWQLLAAMSKDKDQGIGPSEYLAAGYKAERLKGTDAAAVQNCLLSAWAGAQSLALFTPDNIARMERGAAPYGTRGADRGRPVSFDTTNLPTVTLTTAMPSRKAVAVATPVPEAKAVAPSFTIKTLEVTLHQKIPLDQFGIRDRDFSLESVDPHNSVVFTFEDRITHHYGYGDRMDSLNQLSQQMGSANGLNRMTSFAPQDIPDSKLRGVKLVTIPFGAIYIDENIDSNFTYKVIVRVATEALMLDQLPPERRKLYDLRSPAP